MAVDQIKRLYESMPAKLDKARKRFGRALTLAEKILVSHADNFDTQEWSRGKAQLRLRVDRVSLQDATGQMALLQFMQAGKKQVAVPSTVHCDHLIRAQSGASEDMKRAVTENNEVYEFLHSASRKYGIGFWKPGAGIIHQVVLENYAFPGGLMIGADSHTPNGGGLGMVAIGVGGADCGEAMAGLAWEVLDPKLIGVRLTGKISGWTSAKDVITHLLGVLTVKGGTNKIVEYFGPGAESISATGKGTICNMGAELGATTSLFHFDDRMAAYLRATDRADIATLAEQHRASLVADPEVLADPKKYYDEIVEIDLSELEPTIVGPHSPDRARPVSKLAAEVKKEGWPAQIKAALIGSCTNSSYEDMKRSAHIAMQALQGGAQGQDALPRHAGLGAHLPDHQARRHHGDLREDRRHRAGQRVRPVHRPVEALRRGQGRDEHDRLLVQPQLPRPQRRQRGDALLPDEPRDRHGAGLRGHARVRPGARDHPRARRQGVPLHAAGERGASGGRLRQGRGRLRGARPPTATRVQVAVSPTSPRLQLLQPFPLWDGNDFDALPILVKTKGKTTTDHISPAGPWLLVRGHLDKISDNMFLGAVNAFTGEIGKGVNPLTGEKGQNFSKIARELKAKGLGWVVIGDENYGEGSSREHAAMSPRYLGCKVVIVRSFARIAETNLKKQGILPLTFSKATDYDLIEQDDRLSVTGLAQLAPGKPVTVVITKPGGKAVTIQCLHTLTDEQIGWFKAGSALNALK